MSIISSVLNLKPKGGSNTYHQLLQSNFAEYPTSIFKLPLIDFINLIRISKDASGKEFLEFNTDIDNCEHILDNIDIVSQIYASTIIALLNASPFVYNRENFDRIVELRQNYIIERNIKDSESLIPIKIASINKSGKCEFYEPAEKHYSSNISLPKIICVDGTLEFAESVIKYVLYDYGEYGSNHNEVMRTVNKILSNNRAYNVIQ